MPSQLFFTIGGFNVKVQLPDANFSSVVSEKYRPFCIDHPSQIHLTLNLNFQELASSDTIDVYKKEGQYAINGGEFRGVLEIGEFFVEGVIRKDCSVLDSFLRVIFSIFLPYSEGCLIHAAGIACDGGGYIFAGPSSSGKSTTARLAQASTVLNDELVLVRKIDEKYWVCATPFCGDYQEPVMNQRVPFKGVFFLDKTLKVSFDAVSPVEAIVKLMECVFFFDSELVTNQKMLQISQELVKQVQPFRVNILKNESIEELIHDINRSTYCA